MARAKNAQLFIYIVLALDVVLLISNLFQYVLIEDIKTGKFIGDDTIDANDLRQQILGIMYLVAFIASTVVYIMWFRRAYYNLGQAIHTKYSEGWAAGGWFVPIISLFYPYKIMEELYVKTNAILRQQISGYSHQVKLTTIGIWWALWIGSNIIERIGSKLEDTETIDGVLNYTLFSMFSNVLGIILAFVAVKVIKDYHDLEKKYHEVAAQQPGEIKPPEIIL